MGCTPLSYAAECGAYQIAKLLTNSLFHCKTDEVDKDGCSPLDYAKREFEKCPIIDHRRQIAERLEVVLGS